MNYRIPVFLIVSLFLHAPFLSQAVAQKALMLDGKGGYVNFLFPIKEKKLIGTSSNVINSTTFTLEAWVLIKGPGGGTAKQNPFFVQRDRHAGTPSSTVHLSGPSTNNGNIRFAARGPSDADNESDIVEQTIPGFGEWHHYAAVADSFMMYLYIDGEIADSSTITQSGDYATSIDYIDIGRHLWVTSNSESSNFLNGLVDEVRIWNRARSQANIQLTMNNPLGAETYLSPDSGLVGYWQFDEFEDLSVNDDGVDDIRDLTGNGFDGDVEGNATLSTSVPSSNFNQALDLDGVDDFMNLFFPTEHRNIINTKIFTVEMWAFINGPGGGNRMNNPFFVQRDEPGATHSSTIHLTGPITDNDSAWFGLRSSFDPLDADTVRSIIDSLGEWHHYAAVSDSTKMFLYVDGVLVSEKEISHTGDYTTSIDYIEIGRHIWEIDNLMNTNYFNGMIDEVRIWKIPRTRSQIQETWKFELNSDYYSTPDSGLVAYWRFDALENLGMNRDGADDIQDLTDNNFHGDLFGNATLVDSTAPIKPIEITGTDTEPEKHFTSAISMNQNYPNPFSQSTTFSFSIDKPGLTSFKIYDVLGRKVATLIDHFLPAGQHEISFSGDHLPVGIYYYRLMNNQSSISGAFVISR